jgi:hypothetical protein
MAGDKQDAAKATGWRRHFTLRNLTALVAFEAGALMLLAVALGWPVGDAAKTAAENWTALGLGVFGWFLFQGARLFRICTDQAGETPERRRLMMTEMFVWLLVSLAGLCAVALLKPDAGALSLLDVNTANGLLFFLALLAATFVPPGVGVWRSEKLQAQGRADKAILRGDAISGGSLLFGAFAMLLIVILAWAAAHNAFSALGENIGVIATLFVMFAFVFFIVLSSVTRGLNLFQEREATAQAAFAPAIPFTTLASWIDSVLVRIVAPMTGAVQAPDGRHGLGWHHVLIIGVMAPLTLLGYAMPQPWGLIPIAGAFLFALSIGRRWSWVEGDRETASRLRTTKSKDIHVGFSNDLRDEALLGYAFLFVLVPLTLYQLNDMTHAFCVSDRAKETPKCLTQAGDGDFFDWISFFGLELFKAVPLVDWAEIYDFKPPPPLLPASNSDVPQHLIFGSRVLVDFVVMAALFQAIAIFQRNQTQRKLYDSGQLDVLDPISEEDFFETGMIRVNKAAFEGWQKLPLDEQKVNPVVELRDGVYFTAKPAFLKRVQDHVDRQRDQGAARPYASERLDQLVDDDRDDLQAGAKWMVEKYHLLAGSPRHRLNQIDFRNSVSQREGAEDAETPSEITQRVTATNRVLADASQSDSDITDVDIGAFLRLTASVADIPVSQIALTSVLERLHTANALRVLKLMTQSSPAAHPELEDLLGPGCGNLKLGSTLAGVRATVYNSIAVLGERAAEDGTPESRGVAQDALDFCKVKSQLVITGGDRAITGQKAAKAAAERIRKALKNPPDEDA